MKSCTSLGTFITGEPFFYILHNHSFSFEFITGANIFIQISQNSLRTIKNQFTFIHVQILTHQKAFEVK